MEAKEKRIEPILAKLKEKYPKPKIALDYRNAYELLAATILSAQCTDVTVNRVTPGLFQRYPDPQALAQADVSELEVLIKSTGFYHNKAKSLMGMAQGLVGKYGGEVPRTMEQLLELPGVARKTANVVLGAAFHINVGLVVDTHVRRISQRLGLTREDNPEKIEQDLMRLIPRAEWIAFSMRLILHGRETCMARNPACAACVIKDFCPSAAEFMLVIKKASRREKP
jgi:endonuclease-3